MNKCIFILPYFGKFKSYFPLFLRSCIENKNFNWLIITDNVLDITADNIEIINICFDDFKEYLKDKLPFEFELTTTYKLCDFKPAYGLVFEDKINLFDYWGYCDCDMIFGNLDNFLPSILNQNYDKIFAAGHLTLYRNYPENNRRFMQKYKGESQINRVFLNKRCVGFDEDFFDGNVHRLFLDNSAKVFEQDFSANPAVIHSQFTLTKYDSVNHSFSEQPYQKTLYYWDGKSVYGMICENGALRQTEYIYMHLQNRKMGLQKQLNMDTQDLVQIVPNEFRCLSKIPETCQEWESLDLEPKNSHMRDIRTAAIKYKFNRLLEVLGIGK